MVIVDRSYSGAAVAATLQTAMTALTPGAGGTITVSDDSGYPVTGKFEIVVDRGETNEESILINSRSGGTFTIGSRGYDGTTASSHTINQATVELDLSARTVQLFVDHVDDVESDPHSTKLLNNTRHDVEARHQFGGALGTPVTPTALTPDIAGAAGTGNNPSREDHVHNVPAATAVTSGLANAEGSSGSFARADHTHDQAALSINTAELVDGAVTSGKLGALAVTAGKIGANAVGNVEILDGQVGTGELADGGVTYPKIDPSTFPTTTEGSVATSQGTASTTYTDLATLGPDVTMTPPSSGKVKVSIYCQCSNSGISGSLMSFALSAGNTLAASDVRSIGNTGSSENRQGATFLLTGLAQASTLFRAKYRAGGSTSTFGDRRIIVEPVLA